MALLTTHGATNKVQNQLSVTREIRTMFNLLWEFWWYVESITTESFSYVGMTKTAAATCQEAMVEAWTKTKPVPSVTIQNNQATSITYSYISELVADIRTVRDSCGWRVDVQVNENTKTIEPFTAPEE